MIDTEEKQRIVIYRLGSLGDTVVALPCFHKIARTWPHAERIVLTNFPVSSKAAPLEAILRGSGLMDNAIAYPVGTRSMAELWRLARKLRQLRAGVLIYLTPARGLPAAWRDWIFFKFCGFKKIIGVPLTLDLQKSRVVGTWADGKPELERESERLARCLHKLGPIDLDDSEVWNLALTERELQTAGGILTPLSASPYFVINMGGKVAMNDWGQTNWHTLVKTLAERYPNTGLLIVGAAEDSQRAHCIAEVWTGPVVDACGKLTPRESAAAMRNAALFIGHDSGPMHLAAANGVRCVGLFSNYNRPRRWHPRGKQHRILHPMSGLNTISVSDVMHAIQDVLA